MKNIEPSYIRLHLQSVTRQMNRIWWSGCNCNQFYVYSPDCFRIFRGLELIQFKLEYCVYRSDIHFWSVIGVIYKETTRWHTGVKKSIYSMTMVITLYSIFIAHARKLTLLCQEMHLILFNFLNFQL